MHERRLDSRHADDVYDNMNLHLEFFKNLLLLSLTVIAEYVDMQFTMGELDALKP